MPPRQRRPPAPRTVLERYTIRLDRREEKLGFLIQSVPEGGDIYELARRHEENEARQKKALQEAAEAKAKAKAKAELQEGAALAAEARVGDDGERNAQNAAGYVDGAPQPPPRQQQPQKLLAPSIQAAASQKQSSSSSSAAAECGSARSTMAQSSSYAGTSYVKPAHDASKSAKEQEAADMELEAADMAEAATRAAVLDALRLTKAAKVEGEDAQCLAALLSKNDAEREILMEDTGAADLVVDEDDAMFCGRSLVAVAPASTTTSATTGDAAPAAPASSGQKSGEDTAEVAIADADEIDTTSEKPKSASTLNGGANDDVVAIDAPDAPVTNQRSSRRVAAAATAAAAVVPAPAPAPTRAKKNVAKRLTIMPGSPVLIVANNIRKWRKWCEEEYAKSGRSDEVENGDAEMASSDPHQSDEACDTNDNKNAPFTTLPPPSVFDTLDSTIAAALEAGIFNDTEMFKQKINRTSLRCALVGAIREGDYIESVRVQSPAKSYAYQMNGLRRYISTSIKEQIQLFGDCIRHDHNYPVYVTYCRKVVIQPPPPMDLTGATTTGSGSKRSHPVESFDSGPAKRRRKAEVVDVSGASTKATVPPPPQPPRQDEVIDLLDSSDEEKDETNEEEKKECMEIEDIQDAQDRPSKVGCDCAEVVALIDDSPSPPAPPTRLIRPLPIALPDPIPAFHVGDFVLTKYGPGKVVSTRVDRFPETEEILIAPILMYSIAFRYGFAHIPSTEISAIEGSEYTEKRILTYRNITLNKMDLLRLWPLTYLNDSLINFYIKYMIMEKVSATGGTLSVDDFHVFPTYFYSRISHLQNGGTAYKDTKAARKKLYQDVKGWTKGVDIFQKRFLIFPINYDLHWTFVLAANPGDVLKVIPPPPAPRKKKATEAEQTPAPELAGTEVEAIAIDVTNAGVVADGTAGVGSRETSDGGEERSSAPQLLNNDAGRDGPSVAEVPSSKDRIMKVDTAESEAVVRPLNQHCPEMDGASTQGTTTAPADIECVSTTAAPASSKESDSSLAPCLIHFDSGRHFKLHRSATIFKHIRKYLAACYEATKAEEYPQCNITAKTLPGIAPPIPQQDNAKDCGVYTLEFIERVLANPPNIDNEFIERKGVVKDGPFGNNWFAAAAIGQKRSDLTRLIRELEIREYLFEEI